MQDQNKRAWGMRFSTLLISYLTSIPTGRISSIDIGRTNIVYTLNKDFKRTIAKIPLFLVKYLRKRQEVLQHLHELAQDRGILKTDERYLKSCWRWEMRFAVGDLLWELLQVEATLLMTMFRSLLILTYWILRLSAVKYCKSLQLHINILLWEYLMSKSRKKKIRNHWLGMLIVIILMHIVF